jgi:hypothetical protein
MARQQNKKLAAVTTGSAGSSGIPCAMVLTVSFGLSPGTGLSCPHHHADRSARLGLSVGRPGPHDFAVRVSAVRPREEIARVAKASIASPPHVLVTIARTSLFHRGGMPREDHILLENGIKIFLAAGLDSSIGVESPREIRFFAQAMESRKAAAATRNDHRFARRATNRRSAFVRMIAYHRIPGAARIAWRRASC